MDNEALKENEMPIEAPVIDTPVTTVEESVLPEGNVTPIADQMLEEQELAIIAPTVEAVQKINDEIKETPDEVIESLPEPIKEGAQIWKDASEDFSDMIIARTVASLHHNDFSEIEEPSESEILVAGAKAAKELKDEGANKTSIEKAVDGINSEIDANTTLDLIRIYSELKNLENAADLFVDYTAGLNDLEMSPTTKDRVASQVLDNGLFENSELLSALNTSRDYSSRDIEIKHKIFSDFSESEIYCDEGSVCPDTLEIINEAGSFDKALEAVETALEERGVDVDNLEKKSVDCNLYEDLKRFGYATFEDLPTPEEMLAADGLESKSSLGSKIANGAKDLGGKIATGTKDVGNKLITVKDAGVDLIKSHPKAAIATGAGLTAATLGGAAAIVALKKKKAKKDNEAYLDTAELQDSTPTSLVPNGDHSEGVSKDCAVDKNLQPETYRYLKHNRNVGRAIGGIYGGLTGLAGGAAVAANTGNPANIALGAGIGTLGGAALGGAATKFIAKQSVKHNPTVKASLKYLDEAAIQDATPTSLNPNGDHSEEEVSDETSSNNNAYSSYLNSPYIKSYSLGCELLGAGAGALGMKALGKDKKSMAVAAVLGGMAGGAIGRAQGSSDYLAYYLTHPEEDKEGDESESTEEAVAENALSNDDMIQALIEKYKMLPTVETKNFMLQDMKACGFDDSIIAMVQSQGEGNFSEGEDAPVVEGASDNFEALSKNPADSVASDLFDSILGPSVGVADPLDGTLAPGDVAANGAEGLSIWTGLGTDDAEAPMADPSGISVKQEVAEVAAANEDAATQLATVVPGVSATDDAFESLI